MYTVQAIQDYIYYRPFTSPFSRYKIDKKSRQQELEENTLDLDFEDRIPFLKITFQPSQASGVSQIFREGKLPG